MDFEGILPSEISQKEKNSVFYNFIGNLKKIEEKKQKKKKTLIDKEARFAVTRGKEWR